MSEAPHTDITQRLRRSPASMGLTVLNAHELLTEAANEIEVQRMVNAMLRAQLRSLGHIPCVAENAEVMKAEYAMRNAARGN